MADRKRLVELKARYEDIGKARALLHASERVGAYRQTDTYFALGERRLKMREVEGSATAQLVYYERPDRPGAKESEVLLSVVPDAATVKEMLARTLGVQVVVRKRREIYRHEGVQVHLDEVEGLGRFLEFEMAVEDAAEAIERGHANLAAMRRLFDIPDEDLVASSYSDLLAD
ncbi:MAG TPA: class IV adenylate cyclase [Thermoplasmata archaeon]|nr:class IV adenylate cyclase [Thermoplasmata archaeon]